MDQIREKGMEIDDYFKKNQSLNQQTLPWKIPKQSHRYAFVKAGFTFSSRIPHPPKKKK